MVIEPVVSLPSPMLVMVYLGGHWDGKGPVVASLHSLPVWWKGLVVFLHLPGWGKGLVAASLRSLPMWRKRLVVPSLHLLPAW